MGDSPPPACVVWLTGPENSSPKTAAVHHVASKSYDVEFGKKMVVRICADCLSPAIVVKLTRETLHFPTSIFLPSTLRRLYRNGEGHGG